MAAASTNRAAVTLTQGAAARGDLKVRLARCSLALGADRRPACSPAPHLDSAGGCFETAAASHQLPACLPARLPVQEGMLLHNLDQWSRHRAPGYTGYKPRGGIGATTEQPAQGATDKTSQGFVNAQVRAWALVPLVQLLPLVPAGTLCRLIAQVL